MRVPLTFKFKVAVFYQQLYLESALLEICNIAMLWLGLKVLITWCSVLYRVRQRIGR
jgi:hypothetical protein